MRAAALSAFALFALSAAAHAQDVQVAPATLISMCEEQAVLPEGETAEPAAIAAYCQCAIDRMVAALTPAEFSLVARIWLSRSGAGAPPSEQEIAAMEGPEFEHRLGLVRAHIHVQCNRIVFDPRGATPN
jgi:hypothetical protein